MSASAPDSINGFRGAILTKGGAELHVYTDIEDAVATPIGGIYQSSAPAGKPARYSVVMMPDDGSANPMGSSKERRCHGDRDRRR